MSSINDVTVVGRGGQGFCNKSIKKAFIVQKNTMGRGRGSKIVQNYVMSLMGDTLQGKNLRFATKQVPYWRKQKNTKIFEIRM